MDLDETEAFLTWLPTNGYFVVDTDGRVLSMEELEQLVADFGDDA